MTNTYTHTLNTTDTALNKVVRYAKRQKQSERTTQSIELDSDIAHMLVLPEKKSKYL